MMFDTAAFVGYLVVGWLLFSANMKNQIEMLFRIVQIFALTRTLGWVT